MIIHMHRGRDLRLYFTLLFSKWIIMLLAKIINLLQSLRSYVQVVRLEKCYQWKFNNNGNILRFPNSNWIFSGSSPIIIQLRGLNFCLFSPATGRSTLSWIFCKTIIIFLSFICILPVLTDFPKERNNSLHPFMNCKAAWKNSCLAIR